MKVKLKCFAALSHGDSCGYRDYRTYELDEGKTVTDLAKRAGISPEEVKIAFVNNIKSRFETVLNDGDNVGLVPAVGGM